MRKEREQREKIQNQKHHQIGKHFFRIHLFA
jgi:hypothetical protein